MQSPKKKVAVIGTVGLPARYGGFETLTEHLVTNLSDKYDITVYCSGKKIPKEKQILSYRGAKLKYIPLDANGIQSIVYDSWSILDALRYADVLLVLGVAGAWLFPFIRRFSSKKIVVSIDGIEWKRGKWSLPASWYLLWAEKKAIRYSHIDIADNEAIQDYTALRYRSLSRIIEYGADHAMSVEKTAEDFIAYPFLNTSYVFKVCRIEPENNIHMVLSAFSKMSDRHLVIVGNWKNSVYGIQLKAEYSQYSNITLLDPIYDQKCLDLLRSNASLYIHGHSAGGTNPSLVEAMYLGLPVVAFGVSYNKATTERKAVYFRTEEELIQAVSVLSPEKLQQLGSEMHAIAGHRYTWKLIALKYNALMQEALGTSGQKYSVKEHTTDIDTETLQKMGLSHLKYSEEFFKNKN